METRPLRPAKILKPQEPVAVVVAVGMWATRQRYPSAASYPQPLRRASGDGVAPDRYRRSVRQRLMRSPVVVKCDPIGDPALGVVAVGVAFEVDVLVFQAAPQPLDEHVVDPATAAVHRDLDANRRQRAGEDGAGELAALIGIENLRLPVAGQGFLKCRHAERGVPDRKSTRL